MSESEEWDDGTIDIDMANGVASNLAEEQPCMHEELVEVSEDVDTFDVQSAVRYLRNNGYARIRVDKRYELTDDGNNKYKGGER